MSSAKSTYFSDEWLTNVKYSKWIAKVPDDKTKYWCVLCGETRALSNMGAQALNLHAKGAKHQNKAGTLSHIK